MVCRGVGGGWECAFASQLLDDFDSGRWPLLSFCVFFNVPASHSLRQYYPAFID
jgi:hypothetical protein